MFGTLIAIIGLFGGFMYMGLSLAWLVLVLIANWRVFEKAGEKGWKCIIPFYGSYISYRIAWNTNMFWVSVAVSIMSSVFDTLSEDGSFLMGLLSILFYLLSMAISLFYSLNMAGSFGKGIGFGLGIWLLEPIFLMILAFGPSVYQRRIYDYR